MRLMCQKSLCDDGTGKADDASERVGDHNLCPKHAVKIREAVPGVVRLALIEAAVEEAMSRSSVARAKGQPWGQEQFAAAGVTEQDMKERAALALSTAHARFEWVSWGAA